MAPWSNRKRVLAASSGILNGDDNDFGLSVDANEKASTGSHPVRGQNRSLVLEKHHEKHGKASVVITNERQVVGEHSEWWSREMTNLIRMYAPVNIKGWARMDKSKMEEIYKRMADKFDINLEDENIRATLYLTGRKRYGAWRHRCHTHYLQKGGGEMARANPPLELDGKRQADWEWLCNLFQSSEWQRKFEQASQNQSHQIDHQRNGSNSFANKAYVTGKDMVDLYPQFWTTKASKHTEFTSDFTASANERMKIYRNECANNGTSVTVREVLEDALGPAKGYCRGMGTGPKPYKKFRVASQHSENSSLSTELANMKEKLSKADDLIATQAEELRLTREVVEKLKEDQLAMLKQFEVTMANFSGSMFGSQ